MKTSFVVIIAIAITAILFHLVAGASGKEDRHDHQTINNIINKDDDNLWKGVAIGILVTCVSRSLYYGIKDSRWTWCGEDRKPEPLPDPGPAV